MPTLRTYSEMIKLKTFKERFDYLKLDGMVGNITFGYDRYLNQMFYRSPEWRRIRDRVISRDNGCDLGVDGKTIYGRLIIHHMNPVTISDVVSRSSIILDPEYLICVGDITHNALHYGDYSLIPSAPADRKPNDTCPWKRTE